MELYHENIMNNFNRIYMVGIKGFGMASLAYLLKKMGRKVSGSDVDETFPTDILLNEAGIRALIGFRAENISDDIDLIITTGAHGGLHNPEVLAGKQKGIPIMTHAEALGKLMDGFKHKIAICGTHGKTTTSALLAFVLHHLGMPLGYQVGTPSFSGMLGGDFTGTDYFVVESDEYVASPGIDNTPRFMFQNPDFILCTNIDYDHVDVYKDLHAVKEAFYEFFMKSRVRPFISFFRDDMNARSVVERSGISALSYGFSSQADAQISNVAVKDGRTFFSLAIYGKDYGSYAISIPGQHNVANAVGVLTILYALGIDLDKARPILSQFTGSKRRFELLFESEKYVLIDDYAHHPHELEALMQGARSLYPHKRLILLFQPHTYSRTQALKSEFAQALRSADLTYVLDIFSSARENSEDYSINAEQLVQAAQAEDQRKGSYSIKYIRTDSAISSLAQDMLPGDIIITAGAGDIYKLHPAIIEMLKSRQR